MARLSFRDDASRKDGARTTAPDYAASSVPGYDEAQSRNEPSARSRASASLTGGQGALLSDDASSIGEDYGYRRLRFHKNEEVDLYSHARDREKALSAPGRLCVVLGAVLLVAFVLAVSLPTGVFDANVTQTTPATWLQTFQRRMGAFFSYATFQGGTFSIDFTVNRYLLIALGGGALALSGAVYQGALKNALASPTTLGVMQGANTGRIVFVLFFYGSAYEGIDVVMKASDLRAYFDSLSFTDYVWTVYGDALCCLAGSVVVVIFVLLIAHISSQRGISNIVMIITGQIVATLLGAFVALVQYYLTETGDARLDQIRSLQTEAFSDSMTFMDLAIAGIPIVICMAVILILGTRLNLLAFSEDEARSMGVNTTGLRWAMVGACTVLTAVVVAFCGNVGMVGFVIPHIVRRIVGPDFKYLLPCSMIVGALFLVVIFCALSMFTEGVAFNIGTFTGVVGGIFFVIVAVKGKGERREAWI